MIIAPHMRPGVGFKKFERYSHTTKLSKSRRASGSELSPCGSILGILSKATPEEIEQWGTTESPITHKIVQRGSANQARANDVLVLDTRYFYVQRAPRNPGDLGHFTVYFCEERKGLNG